jgi:hypothetical protein
VLRDIRSALKLGGDGDLNLQPVPAVQQTAADLLRADGKKLRAKK